jgi:putative transcriptional regulator
MKSLAGHFLIARPVLRDPNFARSVVLLLQHGSVGAFGLVVNRQAKVSGLPFPVFVGGPCKSEGLLILHGHPEWVDSPEEMDKRQVADGIFIGDAGCLKQLNNSSAKAVLRYRLFTGNSGWGPGQLEGELATGAWSIVPATSDFVFDTPVDEIWKGLLPPQIPEPSVN